MKVCRAIKVILCLNVPVVVVLLTLYFNLAMLHLADGTELPPYIQQGLIILSNAAFLIYIASVILFEFIDPEQPWHIYTKL